MVELLHGQLRGGKNNVQAVGEKLHQAYSTGKLYCSFKGQVIIRSSGFLT
jgi:hypothetical protein